MKHPREWTTADLHQHLQHALDVEFWTIPLYLTALYSIKNLKACKPAEYPDAAKLIQSVVIQEMLHLEIVCNLCNALGYAPRFRAPQYKDEKHIPFIHPKKESLPEHLHGYNCQPGALCAETLKLFCAIELPHESIEPKWKEQNKYHSIAQMYGALKLGIHHLWQKCYVGAARNTRQKISFMDYEGIHRSHHGFSQRVDSLENALKAIDAIVEQGEGSDSKVVPHDFRPPELTAGKDFDPGWYSGHLSHYQKFSILLHHHKKLPEVHAVTHPSAPPAQQHLQKVYLDFLEELHISFNSDGEQMTKNFWDKMFGLTAATIAVWESGACPEFER